MVIRSGQTKQCNWLCVLSSVPPGTSGAKPGHLGVPKTTFGIPGESVPNRDCPGKTGTVGQLAFTMGHIPMKLHQFLTSSFPDLLQIDSQSDRRRQKQYLLAACVQVITYMPYSSILPIIEYGTCTYYRWYWQADIYHKVHFTNKRKRALNKEYTTTSNRMSPFTVRSATIPMKRAVSTFNVSKVSEWAEV